MKKILYGVAFVLLASGIFFTFFHDSSKEVVFAAERAPNFKAVDLNGKKISLDMYKGKDIILLNFWASWCPPCREELPDLAKTYNKLKNKLVIIGVAESSTKEAVNQLVKQDNIKYPVVMDNDGSIANLYGGINAIPTTFLIDTNGNIVNKQVGMFLGESAIESWVNNLHLGKFRQKISRKMPRCCGI